MIGWGKVYKNEQEREQAVSQLRALCQAWFRRGFKWHDIREGLLQFGGQSDSGIDEELIECEEKIKLEKKANRNRMRHFRQRKGK